MSTTKSVLELMDKAFHQAKGFLDMPAVKEGKDLTNKKILESLKSIGVATQTEVDDLKRQVKDLQKKLEASQSRKTTNA